MNGFIVVLDENADALEPWLASRHERELQTILEDPTHDGSQIFVPRSPRDTFVRTITLRDERTGRLHPGRIYQLG